MKKALKKRGFTFIEVISPCPEQYGRRNRMAKPMDSMVWFKEKSVIRHRINPLEAKITANEIVVGEFVDIDKPEFTDLLQQQVRSIKLKLDKERKLTNVPL